MSAAIRSRRQPYPAGAEMESNSDGVSALGCRALLFPDPILFLRSGARSSGHNGRQFVFGFASVHTLAQATVTDAVEEINQESDRKPDYESKPGFDEQAEHQAGAHQHADNRNDWDQRDAEWPATTRIGAAQDDHPDADQAEREESSDICQIGERADIGHHRHSAHRH